MSNEANIQTVIETIDTAISARFQLSQLLDGVNEAKNQVLYCSHGGHADSELWVKCGCTEVSEGWGLRCHIRISAFYWLPKDANSAYNTNNVIVSTWDHWDVWDVCWLVKFKFSDFENNVGCLISVGENKCSTGEEQVKWALWESASVCEWCADWTTGNTAADSRQCHATVTGAAGSLWAGYTEQSRHCQRNTWHWYVCDACMLPLFATIVDEFWKTGLHSYDE